MFKSHNEATTTMSWTSSMYLLAVVPVLLINSTRLISEAAIQNRD